MGPTCQVRFKEKKKAKRLLGSKRSGRLGGPRSRLGSSGWTSRLVGLQGRQRPISPPPLFSLFFYSFSSSLLLLSPPTGLGRGARSWTMEAKASSGDSEASPAVRLDEVGRDGGTQFFLTE